MRSPEGQQYRRVLRHADPLPLGEKLGFCALAEGHDRCDANKSSLFRTNYTRIQRAAMGVPVVLGFSCTQTRIEENQNNEDIWGALTSDVLLHVRLGCS